MKTPSKPARRIEEEGSGLGEVSREQIEDRAAELARMDGRDTVNDGDRRRALEELQDPTDGGLPAELAQPSLENVVAWDEPADSSGHRAPRVELDDEVTAAEQLIQEGIEEAEHERRVAASEEESQDDV